MKIVASLVTTVVTKTNTIINVYYALIYATCVNFSAGCRKEIALK